MTRVDRLFIDEPLELPSKPRERLEADKRTAKGNERLMDVLAALGADREPTNVVEPRHRALPHPAISAQPFARFDAFAGEAAFDVAGSQGVAAAGNSVGLGGRQLGRTPGPVGLANRGDRIEQLLEHHAVVAIGAG